MKKSKQEFIVYTEAPLKPVWTFWNTLNFAKLLQKTKEEALIRYSDVGDKQNTIKSYKITIEEI